jgi:hypothetical protein
MPVSSSFCARFHPPLLRPGAPAMKRHRRQPPPTAANRRQPPGCTRGPTRGQRWP